MEQSLSLPRALMLLVPAFIWMMQLALRKHPVPVMAGSFLAYAWQVQSTLIIAIAFSRMHHLHATHTSLSFYGVPIDYVIGQSVLLGGMFILFGSKQSAFVLTAIALFFLSGIYEAAGIFNRSLGLIAVFTYLLSIVPSLLLGFWTRDNKQLYARAFLQTWIWVSLLMWLLPSIIFEHTDSSWHALLSRPLWHNALIAMPFLIPGYCIISALFAFATQGQGTSFPYDPPRYLVTSGVYAYLSNPMQVGVCLTMLWWGVMLESVYVSLTAPVALLLFIVFKNICNGSSQIGTCDPMWKAYQAEVPKWIPRLTPWQANEGKR